MARPQRPRLVHLDTHVVCWLYAGRVELLSRAAREAIEHSALAVSPMVGLEIQYLREVGRIRHGPRRILASLRRDLGLSLSDLPFTTVAARAQTLAWTRDPFDRLIAGEAAVARAPGDSRRSDAPAFSSRVVVARLRELKSLGR